MVYICKPLSPLSKRPSRSGPLMKVDRWLEEIRLKHPRATILKSEDDELRVKRSSDRLIKEISRLKKQHEFDILILSRKHHRSCCRDRFYDPNEVYLFLDGKKRVEGWSGQKRVAYLSFITICVKIRAKKRSRDCYPRKDYVPPFQYYLLAVGCALLLVFLAHGLSVTHREDSEKRRVGENGIEHKIED